MRRHTTSNEIDGIDEENGLDARWKVEGSSSEQDGDEQPDDGLIRTDGIDETFLSGGRVSLRGL